MGNWIHSQHLAPKVNWIAVVTLTLAALPFLCGAGYMSYRTLWFQYAAARVEGTVVAIAGKTPSLVVEYRTAGGEVLRTETDGSDLYKDIARHDKITIFYDPQQPSDARVDLFIENWLLPMITAFPGVLILLAMLLITRQLAHDPFARPRLKSGGTPVQAEFVRVRMTVDMNEAFGAPRAIGSFTLQERDGRYELTHDGKPRDPYDPAIQRELGLCFIVIARWQDSKTGVEHFFESEPLATNPDRQVRGRSVTVYVDPKRPDRYRMELPFVQKTQPSPITRV